TLGAAVFPPAPVPAARRCFRAGHGAAAQGLAYAARRGRAAGSVDHGHRRRVAGVPRVREARAGDDRDAALFRSALGLARRFALAAGDRDQRVRRELEVLALAPDRLGAALLVD